MRCILRDADKPRRAIPRTVYSVASIPSPFATMAGTIALLLSCVLWPQALAALSDFVRLEADGGDILKPKPPLLASRDGRFIRFDAKDTEIELELGVSVPFLKIPLQASLGAEAPSDHRVTINPAGLLVGATILFTSFLLVPWVLPSGNHHSRRDADLSLGNGGRDSGEGSGWALVREVDHLLTKNNLDPRSCPKKAICLIGHHFSTSMPGLLDTILKFDSVAQMIGAPGILNAVKSGSCDAAYPACFLNGRTMALVPQIFGIW